MVLRIVIAEPVDAALFLLTLDRRPSGSTQGRSADVGGLMPSSPERSGNYRREVVFPTPEGYAGGDDEEQ
jgi:hypothetical protein